MSDLSACWCDARDGSGARGRIRPMRALLPREDPELERSHGQIASGRAIPSFAPTVRDGNKER